MSACDNYRVNLEAANFGDCVCGRPKSEHSEAALTAGRSRQPSSARRSSFESPHAGALLRSTDSPLARTPPRATPSGSPSPAGQPQADDLEGLRVHGVQDPAREQEAHVADQVVLEVVA